jgi:hypothetical protein
MFTFFFSISPITLFCSGNLPIPPQGKEWSPQQLLRTRHHFSSLDVDVGWKRKEASLSWTIRVKSRGWDADRCRLQLVFRIFCSVRDLRRKFFRLSLLTKVQPGPYERVSNPAAQAGQCEV